MLLSYGWRWKKEEPCNIYILLFIYFASAGATSGIPASFLYRNQKEGKERGRGKIGIITHVRTYMRTQGVLDNKLHHQNKINAYTRNLNKISTLKKK